jgi:triacylglycerol lipase
MNLESATQPPYPLHEYVKFHDRYIVNNQQIHRHPVEALCISGPLIPGGAFLTVGQTEDIFIRRRASSGPDVIVRAFTSAGGIPRGGWPVFLYFNGGCWVLGTIETENTVCTNLCVRANCVVITVDYWLVQTLKGLHHIRVMIACAELFPIASHQTSLAGCCAR